MITVLTASRRPDLYKNLIANLEDQIGDLVDEYIVFVNDDSLKEEYKKIKYLYSKIKFIFAKEDYIYKMGFDSLYNLLIEQSKSKYCLMLFDTDTIEVNKDLLKQELSEDKDLYSFDCYMQRGDVWEEKHQLFKKDLVKWFGLVHENQQFNRQPTHSKLTSFKVYHNNSVDKESQDVKKNAEGFIILEKTEIDSDSDKRNLLYETLTWKIVNEGGRHLNAGWFHKHYSINKEIIDEYYNRAKEKFHL
jgi:hypothetical protein